MIADQNRKPGKFHRMFFHSPCYWTFEISQDTDFARAAFLYKYVVVNDFNNVLRWESGDWRELEAKEYPTDSELREYWRVFIKIFGLLAPLILRQDEAKGAEKVFESDAFMKVIFRRDEAERETASETLKARAQLLKGSSRFLEMMH